MSMSQQTQPAGGEVNVNGIVTALLVVVVIAVGGAWAADWAGWISLSELFLPF